MEEVRNWLRSFGLTEYAPQLLEDGWDKLQDLFEIDDKDLTNCINKPGHRKRFELAVNENKDIGNEPTSSIRINKSSESDLSDDTENVVHPKTKDVERWLKRHGLGQYFSDFTRDGWDIPEVLPHMDSDDIDACIHKPGHRQKFKKALKENNFENTNSSEDEMAVELYVSENRTNVTSWLTRQDLKQYIETFDHDGWDTLELLFEMNDEQVKRCIHKPGHIKRFQRAVNEDRSWKRNIERQKSEISEGEPMVVEPCSNGSHECQQQNDPEVASCQDEREDARHPETTTDEPTQEQIKSDETRLKEPVTFGLESSENETISSSDPYEISERINDFDDNPNAASPSEDNGETQMLEAGTRVSLKRVFSMPPSLTVSKTKTVTFGGFQKCSGPVPESVKRQKRNFSKVTEHMKTVLESYKEKDSLYVETNAFTELEHIVQDRHWAVIIGGPGDGKTAMSAHLSLKYAEKGYEHLELHFARDWMNWVDGSSGKDKGKKQFILIDDIFGRMSIDRRKEREWSRIIELMQRVVKKREGSLIVVCTSRKYVFNDVKTKLARFSAFQRTSVVDMTQSELALTKEEKTSIWIKYSKKYKIETEMPDCINSEKSTPHGFPHCVDLFATNEFLRRKGVSFFDNPMEEVCKEIENFKADEGSRILYCVLLLVLFNDNKLTEPRLEDIACNSDEIKRIASVVGLNPRPCKMDLKHALDGLKNTYISEIDSCYSISHDSIRENLAFMFIKDSPSSAIDILNFDYLTDHTRCYKPGQKSEDKTKIFALDSHYHKRLVDRMITEIKNGNVVTICAHQAWNNSDFVSVFLDSVLEKSENGMTDLSNIYDIFNTKDSSTAYLFHFNLFDALTFFNHLDAVKQISRNGKIKEMQKRSQGSVEIPTDLSFDRQLSRYLCQIMDDIGASKTLRDFQITSAISMEILDTICTYIANQKFSCYIFGSHSEGTRIKTHIPKLESDVNYLFCRYDREVILSVSEIKSTETVEYLLAVTDEITKPGYVKLQIVQDGVPQTKEHLKEMQHLGTTLDYKDRIVVYQKRPDKIHVDEVSGAAATTKIVTGHDYELGIYHSYRCHTWPKKATSSWLHRNRHHNWPPPYAIEQMKSSDFFLVPVGHPESMEKSLEWKMSFLLQERILMSTLNDTQYKCYIILKMINNDIISYLVKHPVLVSYHLKTCMFYVVESTPDEFWKPENLLVCVQWCLKSILEWTIKGVCPNYFIPEENLFFGRIHGELQTKLRNVLSNLISSTYHYFPLIKCGNLGAHLERRITGQTCHLVPANNLIPDKIRLYLKIAKFIALVKMRILWKYRCEKLPSSVCLQLGDVNKLQTADDIAEHSTEETKIAISLVEPYVELSFMSNLIVHTHNMVREEEKLKHALLSQSWHELSVLSDQFSAKLKQATFLYMLGSTGASIEILTSLRAACTSSMISVCGCEYHHIVVDSEITNVAEEMSEPDFRKKYCMPCVAFLPTERDLIPHALQYEMQRSSCAMSESVPYYFWYNWAVTDSKVLLYLLLYLNHAKLEMSPEAEEDIKMLENVIETDVNLGHKETGLNVLGWIYRQEENEDRAIHYFHRSLQLQCAYNAAELHLSGLSQ